MTKGTPEVGKGTPEVGKGTPEVCRLALAAVYSRICSQNQTWIAYFLCKNSPKNSDFCRKYMTLSTARKQKMFFGKTKKKSSIEMATKI